MVLVWSGYGLLTGLLFMGAYALGDTLSQQAHWPSGYALGGAILLAALANWFAAAYLNISSKEKEYIDPSNGQRVVFRTRNTLFWIEMQYWSYPAVSAGVVLIGLQLFHHAV